LKGIVPQPAAHPPVDWNHAVRLEPEQGGSKRSKERQRLQLGRDRRSVGGKAGTRLIDSALAEYVDGKTPKWEETLRWCAGGSDRGGLRNQFFVLLRWAEFFARRDDSALAHLRKNHGAAGERR